MSDRALHLVLGWSQHLSGNDQLNESFQAPDLASNTELSGGESMEERARVEIYFMSLNVKTITETGDTL